ncbi:MAG: A24 family peptidase [archaeon]|nr:A24 family peptidase [archaeon]
MLFETIIITITILVLLLSSYSDLKTREIPDWLNYGFLFAVLGIRGIFSVIVDWHIIVSGFLGFILCFLIAVLFYYSNQWGGGDSKLLMGMGAAIGINLPLSLESFNLVIFFIGLLFLGAIYGVLWMGFLAIKKRETFVKEWKEKIKQQWIVHSIVMLLFVATLIFTFFYPTIWPLMFFPPALFYLFLFVNAVEDSCFLQRKKISDVTEGDWLAEEVVVGKEIIVTKRTIEKRHLQKLQKFYREKKLTSVLIKEGVPFVPSFLLGFIVLLIVKMYHIGLYFL